MSAPVSQEPPPEDDDHEEESGFFLWIAIGMVLVGIAHTLGGREWAIAVLVLYTVYLAIASRVLE